MPMVNPEISIIQNKKSIIIGMEIREGGPVPLVVLDSRFTGEGAYVIPITTEGDFMKLWNAIEKAFPR